MMTLTSVYAYKLAHNNTMTTQLMQVTTNMPCMRDCTEITTKLLTQVAQALVVHRGYSYLARVLES